VFATNDAMTGLLSVAASGGSPKILTKPNSATGELDHLFPSILPDGRTVLFTVMMTGSTENGQIVALDLKTGSRKTLIQAGTQAEYVSLAASGQPGYLVYASGGALRAVRFDPERLEVLGDPVVVVDQVATESTGAAQFSISRNGSFVFVPGGLADGAGSFEGRSLVWVDRRGREQPINAPLRPYVTPRISPDGTRIAVAIADQEQDIWVLDLARQPLTRLTFGPSVEQAPLWMPDGRRLVFGSNRAGIPNIFWQLADGTGTMEQLTASQTTPLVPFAISPDGKVLVVNIAGGSDLGLVRLDNPQQIVPLVAAPGNQINAEISPDGHWLAYQSGESGQFEVYVRPFPNVNAGRWQVTSGGGGRPLWARNQNELFYVASRDGALMDVPVRMTPTFSIGSPTKLFDGRYYVAPPGRNYDVSPDGQKFLMVKAPASAAASASMVVVLNWSEELKQRVPTR